jgi:hypothetical protein
VVQDSFSLPLEVRERERARADPSPPALTDGGRVVICILVIPVRPEADGLNGSNVLLLLYPCHKTTMLMVLKSLLKFSYYKHFKP